jgi:hypothetical protein
MSELLLRKEVLSDIEHNLTDLSSKTDISEPARIAEVLRQLRDVGWPNVVDCDVDFGTVTLAVKADSDEKLFLKG